MDRKNTELSAIIFSRNDVEDALKLVEDIYSTFDEIVLIDQSDSAKHMYVLSQKKKKRLKKLKVFYSVALGDPAPLRMWGLGKCSGKWIMLIDTDERINTELKKDIRKLIKTRSMGFAIKRYEHFMKNGKMVNKDAGFTWQIRLYRKDSVSYKGMTHELAEIHGGVERLDGRYFMDHYVDYDARPREYGELNKFQFRMNYKTMNREISDNIYKFLMHGRGGPTTRLLDAIVKAYEIIGFKTEDDELSNTDYFLFYLIKNYGFAKRLNSRQSVIQIARSTRELVKQINAWKNEAGSDEVFRISQIINSIGVIRFLGLDNEETVEKLAKKYKNKKQGISLLISLLKEKYREEKGRPRK
ncbi:MAG: hypothetical protein M1331_03195 [Candidatus Marsarchaeota archaeon]|nr:hypothetical protein [Candidatus Marsarchaeota archaeon]MCL5106372.1 hypothetical protein [Candidatus Marsarchaeota archaeon]